MVLFLLMWQFCFSWDDWCAEPWHVEKAFLSLCIFMGIHKFFYLLPSYSVICWEREGLCLDLLVYPWDTTCYSGSWDNIVYEQLIFQNIQLKRHILFCILSYQHLYLCFRQSTHCVFAFSLQGNILSTFLFP